MPIPRTSPFRFAGPLVAAIALVAVACDTRPSPDPGAEDAAAASPAVQVDLTAAPEATSLLGEPLYPMIQDSATTARLHAQLDSAEAVYEADPDDADALVWLGRRHAYAGYYRDAIDVFTEGIRKHPDDARFYRHRGHRWISVREFDRAIEDLQLAVRLTSGEADVVEPDGAPNAAGIPRSTLQTNIWYHLGLARYLQHDFEGAAYAYRRGWELSPNDDMRVAMADWLWLALKRLDRDAEAAELLDEISTDMEILENDAYHTRLRVYKGELPQDSLFGGHLGDADALDVATHGYGLGAWRLVRGDRPGARAAFERVLETGYWPAFGYIAAEAELRAMGTDRAPGPEPSSREMGTPDPGAMNNPDPSAVDTM